jgi:hypothetical protein
MKFKIFLSNLKYIKNSIDFLLKTDCRNLINEIKITTKIETRKSLKTFDILEKFEIHWIILSFYAVLSFLNVLFSFFCCVSGEIIYAR